MIPVRDSVAMIPASRSRRRGRRAAGRGLPRGWLGPRRRRSWRCHPGPPGRPLRPWPADRGRYIVRLSHGEPAVRVQDAAEDRASFERTISSIPWMLNRAAAVAPSVDDGLSGGSPANVKRAGPGSRSGEGLADVLGHRLRLASVDRREGRDELIERTAVAQLPELRRAAVDHVGLPVLTVVEDRLATYPLKGDVTASGRPGRWAIVNRHLSAHLSPGRVGLRSLRYFRVSRLSAAVPGCVERRDPASGVRRTPRQALPAGSGQRRLRRVGRRGEEGEAPRPERSGGRPGRPTRLAELDRRHFEAVTGADRRLGDELVLDVAGDDLGALVVHHGVPSWGRSVE